MQEIEAREGQPIDELVRDLYEVQGLTLEKAAEKLGITKSALSRWLPQLGIKARRTGPRRPSEQPQEVAV